MGLCYLVATAVGDVSALPRAAQTVICASQDAHQLRDRGVVHRDNDRTFAS